MAAALLGLVPASQAVTCRVELDRGVLPAGSASRAVIKVSLEAPASRKADRPPVNVALVLDRSGSMSGGKLEKMKEATLEALRRLGGEDVASVVVYNSEVNTLAPAMPVARMENVQQAIRELTATGNTALFGGVSQGANEVRRHQERRFVNRVLLLSDGQANVGPSSPEELGRLGSALAKERISVTTIGVGTDYNEDLMTRLSQAGEGNTYFVENSNDLPRIFAAEIGDLLNVVAREITIEITCADGVRPCRVIGREGRIDGRTVRVTVPQLYGGQQKYALIEVELEPGAEGARREVATATCVFEDAATRRQGESRARADVEFSRDEQKVDASVNVSVHREVILNVAAREQEEALALERHGKTKLAAEKLAANARQLEESGKRFKDDGLIKQADLFRDRAAAADAGGFDSRDRKAMAAESYQIQTQQNER